MGATTIFVFRFFQLLLSIAIMASVSYITNWWHRFWHETPPINILYFFLPTSFTIILLIPLTLYTYYLSPSPATSNINSPDATTTSTTKPIKPVTRFLQAFFAFHVTRHALLTIEIVLSIAWLAAAVESYLFLDVRVCRGYVCDCGRVAVGGSALLCVLFIITFIMSVVESGRRRARREAAVAAAVKEAVFERV